MLKIILFFIADDVCTLLNGDFYLDGSDDYFEGNILECLVYFHTK